MRRTLTTAALLLGVCFASACENPCIHMCQQYERYLDRCGYGWSTVFRDRGWDTIEDCYDDHWESEDDRYGECDQESHEYAERSCY